VNLLRLGVEPFSSYIFPIYVFGNFDPPFPLIAEYLPPECFFLTSMDFEGDLLSVTVTLSWDFKGGSVPPSMDLFIIDRNLIILVSVILNPS
jgi:hypothetical protein